MLKTIRFLSFASCVLMVFASKNNIDEHNNNNQLINSINDDQLIAEESKRYFQAVPFTSTSTSNALASVPSPTTTKTTVSSSSSLDSLKDIYKKAASEYWPQNDIPTMHHQALSNHIAESDYGGGHHSSYGGGAGGGGHVSAGTPHETEYMVTPFTQGYMKGREINISPEHKPITLHYRTHAQPIVVHQTRLPGPKPEVKHTTSHEEPQRVVHEVIRPIIQEVHEIIQPYRRVVQQVQPVIEEVRTIIAKDAGKAAGGGAGGGGSGSMVMHSGGGAGSGGASYGGHSMHKASNHHHAMYHASASNELVRQIHHKPATLSATPTVSAPTFRKSAIYETTEEDAMLPLAANNLQMQQHPNNNNNNNSNGRIIRSRVFLTPKGIPVYQSNYRAPLYL